MPAADPPAPERLPLPVTDTHCHMDMARGEPHAGAGPDQSWAGPAQALATAAAVNVTRVVQIGCDLPGASWAVDAAQRFPEVVAAVALHPNEAPRLAAEGVLDEALAEIDRLAESSDRVRAVGETGLDHYRTGGDGHAVQEASFRAHVEMARRHAKALVIHDRDAHADVLRVLDDMQVPECVVFHCFSGDAAMAVHCAERGWFISFAGTVTFANAARLREALSVTPMDRLLVETDAPFLTPHPYRGRPNGSYLVPITVRRIAEVLGTDLETTCAVLQRNTNRAFGPW
ncbi:MAG TPA: TatD family hydrolase [Jiangellaceae bacterium]|nr:TatD family hydrolase [Jiangellaceae bacterium]